MAPALIRSNAANFSLLNSDMYANSVSGLFALYGAAATVHDVNAMGNTGLPPNNLGWFNHSSFVLSHLMMTDNVLSFSKFSPPTTMLEIECQAVRVDGCLFARNIGLETASQMDGVVLDIQAPSIALVNSEFNCNQNKANPQALPVHIGGESVLFSLNILDPKCEVACPTGYSSPFENVANCMPNGGPHQ